MANVKAPALPLPAVNYSQGQAEQLTNVLRLYFNQLDAAINALNAGGGGGGGGGSLMGAAVDGGSPSSVTSGGVFTIDFGGVV